MKVFWKVHISNFDEFEKFVYYKYKYFINGKLKYFKSYYDEFDYLYLFISPANYLHTEHQMTFSYNDEIGDPHKIEFAKYMGEFNLIKERSYKLAKLNIISNL